MPAYIIAQINVINGDKYQEYAKLAGPATLKHGGRFLVRGGEALLPVGRIPAAREKRIGGADFNTMVVEGAQP
jgi:uncharacterized protein (DUF1330 family)